MNKIKNKFRFSTLLIVLLPIIFMVSCDLCDLVGPCPCPDPCPVANCFPNTTTDNLRICLSTGEITCPDGTQDCYMNLGNFYSDAWKHLQDSLGSAAAFDDFISIDTLISGAYTEGGGGGTEGLPECNLPPLPIGNNTLLSKPSEEVLYASITSIEDIENSFKLANEELLFYNFNKVAVDSGITITLFDYDFPYPGGYTSAFDYVFNKYRIGLKDSLGLNLGISQKPTADSSENYYFFDLKHEEAITTRVIKCTESSFLRLRYKSATNQIKDPLNLIEIYK